MATAEDIRKALTWVMDPEIGLNIVDLGLIYNIEIEEKKAVITMTLTTQGCPMHDSMKVAVENVVKRLEPDKEAEIRMVWEPPWTPERMTQSARAFLGV
jgi:metal-sulfur cluster biosynthetic enzyme